MGCAKSSPNSSSSSQSSSNGDPTIRVRKPEPWNQHEPVTRAQLKAMRDEFWSTVPIYGGRQEIWDTLRQAAESELHLAQAILDSAGINLHTLDMRVCFDKTGTRYELPLYVLSEPDNLILD